MRQSDKSTPCRRAPAGQTVEERRIMHRARMLRRRERQLAKQPGFTAVRNNRINSAIEIAQAAIMLAAVERGDPIHPQAALNLAVQKVRRKLPAPRMARGHPRPTRNDDPAYRKDFVRDFNR